MWIRRLDIENFRGIETARVNLVSARQCLSDLMGQARVRCWKLLRFYSAETGLFRHLPSTTSTEVTGGRGIASGSSLPYPSLPEHVVLFLPPADAKTAEVFARSSAV